MADWKTLIGNGLGVFCIFSQDQVDETGYNEAYLTLLQQKAAEEYTNMVNQVANRQGIFENLASKKLFFYQQIKENVFRQGNLEADYLFNRQFYYNPTLSQGEVLGLVKNGNISDFLNHADTQQLTWETGAEFLDFLL